MSVPRLWPDSPIVCVASGPSLTVEDIARVAGRAKILAINDAIRLAHQADAHFAAGLWWLDHPEFAKAPTPLFKFTISTLAANRYKGLDYVPTSGPTGLHESPDAVRDGGHSGYAAVNLAAHLAGPRIVLLGYDMQESPQGEHHFKGAQHDGTHLAYPARLKVWPGLAAGLAERGIELVNATRATALTEKWGVPCRPLEDLFPDHVEELL